MTGPPQKSYFRIVRDNKSILFEGPRIKVANFSLSKESDKRTGGGNITVTTERLRQRRCRASLHKIRETKDLKRKSERTMKEG